MNTTRARPGYTTAKANPSPHDGWGFLPANGPGIPAAQFRRDTTRRPSWAERASYPNLNSTAARLAARTR